MINLCLFLCLKLASNIDFRKKQISTLWRLCLSSMFSPLVRIGWTKCFPTDFYSVFLLCRYFTFPGNIGIQFEVWLLLKALGLLVIVHIFVHKSLGIVVLLTTPRLNYFQLFVDIKASYVLLLMKTLYRYNLQICFRKHVYPMCWICLQILSSCRLTLWVCCPIHLEYCLHPKFATTIRVHV